MADVRVMYQQLAGWARGRRNSHQQGMRLECLDCLWVMYFGDSSSGDREMAKAKREHCCHG